MPFAKPTPPEPKSPSTWGLALNNYLFVFTPASGNSLVVDDLDLNLEESPVYS
jgi:hypothetical protein